MARLSNLPPGSPLATLAVLIRKWQIDCGARLIARRNELGLPRREVCARIDGIEESTLMRLEVGAIPARDHMKAAVALALETEIDELWPTLKRAELEAAVEAQRVAA